jgi:hypothetical protein
MIYGVVYLSHQCIKLWNAIVNRVTPEGAGDGEMGTELLNPLEMTSIRCLEDDVFIEIIHPATYSVSDSQIIEYCYTWNGTSHRLVCSTSIENVEEYITALHGGASVDGESVEGEYEILEPEEFLSATVVYCHRGSEKEADVTDLLNEIVRIHDQAVSDYSVYLYHLLCERVPDLRGRGRSTGPIKLQITDDEGDDHEWVLGSRL